MADFATWAVAALPGMGLDPDKFLLAYRANQDRARDIELEASPIVPPLLKILESGDFEGTALVLLKKLGEAVSDEERRLWTWPRRPLQLVNQLMRLAPALATISIEVERIGRRGTAGDRIIAVRMVRPPEE